MYINTKPTELLLGIEGIATYLFVLASFLLIPFYLLRKKWQGNIWVIIRAIFTTFFLIWIIVIIIVHVVAFFSTSGLKLDPYTILNWPYRYNQLCCYPYDDPYVWPFLQLFNIDVPVSYLGTVIVVISSIVAYISSRKSRNKERIRRVTNTVFIVTIIIAAIITAVGFWLNLLPDGRTIFTTSSLLVVAAISVFIFTVWKPLYSNLFIARKKTFSERMKDLTADFAQVSSSADLILEQMRQAIEAREQEIQNRETRLTHIEHSIEDLSDKETKQQKRVKNLEETKPDAEREFEKMLDKRDRKALTFGLVSLVIGAVLGVIAYAIAHGIHLWGL
jgi:hypothetical protein